MEHLLNLINGELCPAQSGATIDVYAPATGTVIAQAPDSDERDVQAAVELLLTLALWSARVPKGENAVCACEAIDVRWMVRCGVIAGQWQPLSLSRRLTYLGVPTSGL